MSIFVCFPQSVYLLKPINLHSLIRIIRASILLNRLVKIIELLIVYIFLFAQLPEIDDDYCPVFNKPLNTSNPHCNFLIPSFFVKLN